jgi:hypothetical protein
VLQSGATARSSTRDVWGFISAPYRGSRRGKAAHQGLEPNDRNAGAHDFPDRRPPAYLCSRQDGSCLRWSRKVEIHIAFPVAWC